MKNTENTRIDEIIVLNDEYAIYEIDGESYSLNELKAFITNCDELAKKTCRQTRFIEALKLHNSELTLERNKLCDRCMAQSQELKDIKAMSMFEFGNTYCSTESLEADGHAFARSLGVGQ